MAPWHDIATFIGSSPNGKKKTKITARASNATSREYGEQTTPPVLAREYWVAF